MHKDESHPNDKMGHRHARINTRSFVVSIKFLRTVCYSYIAVLTFNVIYSTIFDFDCHGISRIICYLPYYSCTYLR